MAYRRFLFLSFFSAGLVDEFGWTGGEGLVCSPRDLNENGLLVCLCRRDERIYYVEIELCMSTVVQSGEDI